MQRVDGSVSDTQKVPSSFSEILFNVQKKIFVLLLFVFLLKMMSFVVAVNSLKKKKKNVTV